MVRVVHNIRKFGSSINRLKVANQTIILSRSIGRSHLCPSRLRRLSHNEPTKVSKLRVIQFRAIDKGDSSTDSKNATVYSLDDKTKSLAAIKQHEIVPESIKDWRRASSDIPIVLYNHVIKHFLPAGYPLSVASGYTRFCGFCFLASVAGSSAMVLSTQTLLLAVGVVGSSQQTAPVMAGALNWVLKDGIGQLGGVIFASRMGRTRKFDANPKKWRMVSALSLDASNLLEIISPLVSTSMVLPIACVANIGKNIGFLTAGASRAALHQSLAIDGNLGDVTAKAGSQSMAAGLIGTGIGIGLSSLLAHDVENFILGFLALSLVHQTCNYASLKTVPLVHFNRHRLHCVLSHFLNNKEILSPPAIAQIESYFPMRREDDSETWLSIGSNLFSLCPTQDDDLERLLLACPEEAYVINVVNGRVHLVFLADAAGQDLILGMMHAHLLLRAYTNNNPPDDNNNMTTTAESSKLDIIASTHKSVKKIFPEFMAGLEKEGWKTGSDVTNIESDGACRLNIIRPC